MIFPLLILISYCFFLGGEGSSQSHISLRGDDVNVACMDKYVKQIIPYESSRVKNIQKELSVLMQSNINENNVIKDRRLCVRRHFD